MEISKVGGNGVISESTSSLQSSSEEMEKNIGRRQIIEKTASMEAEESSKMPLVDDVLEKDDKMQCNEEKQREIKQEELKSTLQEIISEIEENLPEKQEDVKVQSAGEPEHTGVSANEDNLFEAYSGKLDRQTSTTSLEEQQRESSAAALLSLLSRGDLAKRPHSMPANLAHLWQSLKIANELNQSFQGGEVNGEEADSVDPKMMMMPGLASSKSTASISESSFSSSLQRSRSEVVVSRGFKPSDTKNPNKTKILTDLSHKIWGRSLEASGHKVNTEDGLHSKAIDLEKLFTPASDSGEITPSRSRKMYASSSFYAPNHPTMEEQVELARRISHSLSDISNRESKGQSMYVNRKKRSVKWVHEGEGHGREPESENIRPPWAKETKPPLKLVMNPRGQVQDLTMLKKQGYAPDTTPMSPEVCFDLVRDLNAPKGKGAELFAKRRKRSENWIIDENNVKTPEAVMSQSPLSKLPPPSYLQGSAQRVENVQKMNQIQERFNQPRIKLIKSPWEAALEGSVENAFQEMSQSPRGFVSAPTPTALKRLATPPPPSPPASATPDLYKPKAPRAWNPQPTCKTFSSVKLDKIFAGSPMSPVSLAYHPETNTLSSEPVIIENTPPIATQLAGYEILDESILREPKARRPDQFLLYEPSITSKAEESQGKQMIETNRASQETAERRQEEAREQVLQQDMSLIKEGQREQKITHVDEQASFHRQELIEMRNEASETKLQAQVQEMSRMQEQVEKQEEFIEQQIQEKFHMQQEAFYSEENMKCELRNVQEEAYMKKTNETTKEMIGTQTSQQMTNVTIPPTSDNLHVSEEVQRQRFSDIETSKQFIKDSGAETLDEMKTSQISSYSAETSRSEGNISFQTESKRQVEEEKETKDYEDYPQRDEKCLFRESILEETLTADEEVQDLCEREFNTLSLEYEKIDKPETKKPPPGNVAGAVPIFKGVDFTEVKKPEIPKFEEKKTFRKPGYAVPGAKPLFGNTMDVHVSLNDSNETDKPYEKIPVKSLISTFEQSTRPVLKYRQMQDSIPPSLSPNKMNGKETEQFNFGNYIESTTSQMVGGQNEQDAVQQTLNKMSDEEIHRIQEHYELQKHKKEIYDQQMQKYKEEMKQFLAPKIKTETQNKSLEQISQKSQSYSYTSQESYSKHLSMSSQSYAAGDGWSMEVSRSTEPAKPTPAPSYSSQHSYPGPGSSLPPTQASYQPLQHLQPAPSVTLSYGSGNNYNTAPRGWAKTMSYYRPVTFNAPHSTAYTDF